jgi:hypothetical protein
MAENRKRRRGGYGIGINLTGPGMMFTGAFIALAIGMGVLLSRGVTPRSVLSDPGETGDLEVVEETPGANENRLQLKTIKFRECASTVTIDLLLDRSGSMAWLTPSGVRKIDRLKEAVLALTQNSKDQSIIGFQSFDSSSITDDVPISYYKDVKALIPIKVAALRPGDATPTHDALEFSYQRLKEAIPKFPKERQFNFIFVSDGAPCPGIGCNQPGADQDPRKYTPNPADEIKALGVNVYSLGIFTAGDPQTFLLEDLLKSIASKPENYYAANSGDDVKKLLTQISNRICEQEPTPTP